MSRLIISFKVLECPNCECPIDEDRCFIDDKGYGYCYICGKVVFRDTPKKVKVIFS